MSTAPSKLAVEIAEAICANMQPKSVREINEAGIAALIDAKIRPLVEDGARLDHLEAKRVPGISTHWHTGLAYMTTLRSGIDEDIARKRAIDHARAQRPAPEGSDKP